MLLAVFDVIDVEHVAIHAHDTYGQGLANILTAIQVCPILSCESAAAVSAANAAIAAAAAAVAAAAAAAPCFLLLLVLVKNIAGVDSKHTVSPSPPPNHSPFISLSHLPAHPSSLSPLPAPLPPIHSSTCHPLNDCPRPDGCFGR